MMKKNLLMLLCAVSLLTNVAYAGPAPAPADAVKYLTDADKKLMKEAGKVSAFSKRMNFANRGISSDVNSFWNAVKTRGSEYATGANWKPKNLFGWNGRATGVGSSLASDLTRGGIWGAYVDAVARGDKSLMHRLGAKIAAMTHLNQTGFGKWFGGSRVAKQGSYLTAAVLADFLAALPTHNSSLAGGIYRGGRSLSNWGGRATGMVDPYGKTKELMALAKIRRAFGKFPGSLDRLRHADYDKMIADAAEYAGHETDDKGDVTFSTPADVELEGEFSMPGFKWDAKTHQMVREADDA